MTRAGLKKHVHNYSIKTPLGMTEELRSMGVQDVQLKECECGDRQMFILNADGEWEQLRETDAIYKFMHMR